METSAQVNTNETPLRKLLRFAALVAVAIGARYLLPEIVSDLFFIATLIFYFRSDDEAMWLAFFLTMSDGIFGFFGPYEAVLQAMPGLPPVEIGQFYILLSVVKAWTKQPSYRPFFQTFLIILMIYLVFLIAQGYVLGISTALNVQFRTFRLITPWLLLFTLPRLMQREEQYIDFFKYIFPVAIFAFAAQIFTIVMAQSPPAYWGLKEEGWWAIKIDSDNPYRGIYSEMTLLITLFGALYYLAKGETSIKPVYLFGLLAANFLSVFLSATRGWILAFGLAIALFFLIGRTISVKQLARAAIGMGVFIMVVFSTPVLKLQLDNTIERLTTLEKLAGGDMSAGGTLLRIKERGPRVMKQWRESPITGWGFSNHYYRYRDGHVANQNILLHSGIIGGMLLWGFFFFAGLETSRLSHSLTKENPYKKGLLMIPLFFFSWFVLHSSSRQFFGYDPELSVGLIQAVFFSFAALIHHKACQSEKFDTPEEKDKLASSIPGNEKGQSSLLTSL